MKELPAELEEQIEKLVSDYPAADSVIKALIEHFQGSTPSNGKPIAVTSDSIIFTDMSLILPQRRKCSLVLSHDSLSVLVNEQVLTSLKWNKFEQVLCLKVPGKPKPTWNFVLYKGADSVVCTLGDVSADKFLIGAKPGPLRTALMSKIHTMAPKLVFTDSFELAVVAHIGSKDGILYFLVDSLFFGFRKPVLLLEHSEIQNVSFTVITSSTFNIVVKLNDGSEHEFAMIDQASFNAISDYTCNKKLENASLAEERRAKRHKAEVQEEIDDDDLENDKTVEYDEEDLESDGSGASESEDSAQGDAESSEDEVEAEGEDEDDEDDEDDEEDAEDDGEPKEIKIDYDDPASDDQD